MSTLTQHNSADYVVIGGGTAGLVVAARLAEDPDKSVLVLEAGPESHQDPRVQVPAFWQMMLKSELDWQLQTTPQPGLDGRAINIPQGKMVGGSSAINAQFLAAPSAAVMDAWAQLGNPGWEWASFAPYYQRPFTLHAPDAATVHSLALDWIDPQASGTDGPIQTMFTANSKSPVPRAWADAFASLDLQTSADPYSGRSLGAFNNLATIDPRTGTRSYAATGYALPALQRPNFRIVTGVTVNKITFEESQGGLRASGVEVVVDGKTQTVSASKEVILAAGAYQSPKVLELSGIGSGQILEKHGIKTLVDNPNVGEHLQDHLMSIMSFELIDGIETVDGLMRQEPEVLQAAQQQYETDKSGPFAIGGVGSHSYLPIIDFTGESGRAKQEKLLDSHLPKDADKSGEASIVRSMVEGGQDGSGATFLFLGQYASHENAATAERAPVMQSGAFASIGTMQTLPVSRGSVHLTSAEPQAKPEIDHQYLSHDLDVELMARHLMQIEKVQQQPPLAGLFKAGGRRNHTKAFVKTLDEAKQYVRETATTASHGCGSCSMRPRDKGGVVDSSLKVYGTRNLRVVDASIFPIIPRGNTQSTVYAVAEKAADIIRADAKS